MDLECPYCENAVDINHDGGSGYEQNVKHEIECKHCGKMFVFETSIIFYYEPAKADCLNDGNHDYQITHTIPKECSVMRCRMCDDQRNLNDEERKKYNIGTVESYFKKIRK